jgi:hypothetical protein
MKVHIESVVAQAVARAMTAPPYRHVNSGQRLSHLCWIDGTDLAFHGLSTLWLQ